ncbi:MAG: transposase, partial [Proteobacteria bacterium]|nr:transposase [Pseudomonadota bacterium]
MRDVSVQCEPINNRDHNTINKASSAASSSSDTSAKCRCGCNACVETALGPAKLKPGARYSIDFAIEVAVAKYADHAPLERQVRIMAREGLVIDSQTLWDQIDSLAKVLRALPATLKEYLHAQPVLGADETRWRMLSAKGKDLGEAKQWQVWGLSAPKAVCYAILDSRSTEAGRTVLGGYRGIVMADGYGVYGSLSKGRELHVGELLGACAKKVSRHRVLLSGEG